MFLKLFILGPEKDEGVKHCQKKRNDHPEMKPFGQTRDGEEGQGRGYEKRAGEEGRKLKTYHIFPK